MYRMCVCVCVCRVCVCVPVGGVNALFDSLIRSLLLSLLSLLSSPPVGCTLLAAQTPLLSPHSPQCCQTGLTAAGFVFQKCSSTERGREGERERAIVSSQGQRGERRRGRTGVIFRAGPTVILMPCVCVAGPQEEAMLGSAGWATPEELSEQASQAQHLERLAQLCIMSKQPHLALEYSGKATKIHQRTFGNDHPITARSLELMATVYAEIGKTEYSGRAQHPACTLTLQTHHPPLLLLLPSGVTSAFPCYKSLIPIDHSMSRVVYFDKPARRKPNTLLNAFERLAGSVCVRSVQTLRRRRVHQRHRQLSSTFPPGETLRGPSQEGPPPPTGGHAEGQGDQWQSPHLHFKEARSQLRVGHRAHPQAERRAAGSLQGAGDDGTRHSLL
ncbi:nutritionally-regulated adipose and cardiac enriched protein homolog isoform X3 [Genypterus blacodes]|uniref:nutritionally-regulated adipose and cardiac enriched protein homolog isoform X3 n=1 Tax=Genypterus blacodes TaxID=154954 RepID=UPI003F766F86